MRVFIVDDEPLMIVLLKDALKETYPHLQPVSFEDPQLLLDAAKNDVPDVVFLDIEIPGMNGLTLAKALQDISPTINIIFVTGYSKYTMDAFNLYASSYLMKPVNAEDVAKALNNLRYPIVVRDITVKTFGNFSVCVKNTPVRFRLAKSRELLAYLVDREGASVTKKEVAAAIYEADDYSRAIQAEITRVARWLDEDLKAAGADEIFRRDSGFYSVNRLKFSCDLYDYLEGHAIKFTGEYMEQYSWAELRRANLMEL